MPNQNNPKPQQATVSTPVKNYDAGDLWDAHSLAESDLNWCEAAMSSLRDKITAHKKYMTEAYDVHQAHFEQIETMLGMYEYLIDDRLNHHRKEAEAYKAEYEKDKAVIL